MHSGPYTTPSGITLSAPITWHEMNAASLSLVVNEVDYVANKGFISLDMSWDNTFRPGFFPRGTAGLTDGYATQGRLEIGDRVASFNFVVRFRHGSTELERVLTAWAFQAISACCRL